MPLHAHSRIRAFRPFVVACLCLVLAATAADARRKKAPKPVEGTLDDGKLVTSYFQDGPIAFVDADEIDYLWVKEGLDLEGRTLHFVDWPDPEFLGEGAGDRDAEDRSLARRMNNDMADVFEDSWSHVLTGLTMSREEGDVEVVGRIVDCSTGNTAAKVLVGFGAGAGYTTVDLKMTDKATGELLVAMHHRVVSGTSWSTTDSKFLNWTEKFAKKVRGAGGFWELYQDGKPVDD